MNKIIESFLDTHKKEYAIEDWSTDDAFEHFINRCIINKYTNDRFDPETIMTDDGEKGLDGVAICVNDRIITSIDELESLKRDSNQLNAKFIFIQSKTSESFQGDEIGTFIYGVKAFFAPKEVRPVTNKKMETLIQIKDTLYTYSVDMGTNPIVEMFFVACGKWNAANGLQNRIDLDKRELEASGDFSCVNFYPYDSEKIITTYKELKKKISRVLQMEKRVTFPSISGVKQAFLGLVRCKDFLEILKDSDGNMLTNIFEDNVRDFQGYNQVNEEIKQTLHDVSDQDRFGILNNGITIVAKGIKLVGDNIEIYDFQIVNGCQTSYVLFDNKEVITNSAHIMLKIIEVSETEVADRVIYTTNRQTEVKSEAFAATKLFHKRLQDYYNAVEPAYRLYYERRSKQYDLDDNVNKNKVITLTLQIQSYIAMFLNEPHSTHRYYGELLRSYSNKIFLDTDDYAPYFCASYFYNYVDSKIRSNIIDKRYKLFKFHLICAMRTIAVGSIVAFGQARTQKKMCKEIWNIIMNQDEMLRLLKSAVTCLDAALNLSSDIPQGEKHRSKEVTTAMINYVDKQAKATKEKAFLKQGDIVHCTVTAINVYSVDVRIKTDDARNYGSIYISRIAAKYIEDIRNEVHIGEIFQAKIINDDFYEKPWGWELSKLL